MTTPLFNPFADNIVSEVRRVDNAVQGLNDHCFQKLLVQFESLVSSKLPRRNCKLKKVQFVTSSEPGYGKSHLIGRLFQKLSGRANLVYISPFYDPQTAWKSILMRIIQEMEFPDNVNVGYGAKDEPSQLEEFAHGLLTRLTALAIHNGTIKES